jgi:hypothetical protein
VVKVSLFFGRDAKRIASHPAHGHVSELPIFSLKSSAQNMNQIILFKVIPVILNFLALLLSFFFPGGHEIWVLVLIGLIILDAIVITWNYLIKAPNVEITRKWIKVNGLPIDHCNVLGWRVFRASRSGERGRFLELKLAKPPTATYGWKFAKIFEQVALLKQFDRKMSLAREPRIIASLNHWDLQESEIDRALQNLETGSLSNGEIF